MNKIESNNHKSFKNWLQISQTLNSHLIFEYDE